MDSLWNNIRTGWYQSSNSVILLQSFRPTDTQLKSSMCNNWQDSKGLIPPQLKVRELKHWSVLCIFSAAVIKSTCRKGGSYIKEIKEVQEVTPEEPHRSEEYRFISCRYTLGLTRTTCLHFLSLVDHFFTVRSSSWSSSSDCSGWRMFVKKRLADKNF